MQDPNPNGANQFQLDPRQNLCWGFYINPKSETFGNGTQSAIKAGYEPDYADQITTVAWFKGKLRRLNMLEKGEKVLDEMLEMPVKILKFEGSGEDRVEVVVTEPALVKIKQDTAKFITERLGKDDGYSSRSEVTGKGGESIMTGLSDEQKAKLDKVLGNDKQGSTTASNTGDNSGKSVPLQQ